MATINGGAGPDDIDGTSSDDTITAGGGDDTVRGNAGNDTIFGDGIAPPSGGSIGQFFYEFYNLSPRINTVDDIPVSGAASTGYVSSIDVDTLSADHGTTGSAANRELYAVRWRGTIEIGPGESGSYTFSTTSDDGSKLFVNGTEVVDNDGDHGTRTRSGSIVLDEGTHDIEFNFYEAFGGDNMSVSVNGPATTGTEELVASGLVGNPDDNSDFLPGDDTLIGGDGDDTIYGQEGDDILIGDGASTDFGLNWEFYNVSSSISSVDQIPTTGAAATGFTNEIDVDALAFDHATSGGGGGNPSNFGVRYTGTIEITAAGNYTFFTNSDDGSKLFINGNEVVDNDALQSNNEESGIVNLPAGSHTITIEFFERSGDEILGVNVQGPDTGGAKQGLFASGLISSTESTTPGDDDLFGGEGSDTFTGGDGNDYFAGFGGGATVNDTITDFEAGDGVTTIDVADMSPHYTSFKTMIDNTVQSGSDVIITTPDGATVTINNITIADLTSDNTLVPCFTPGTRIATPAGMKDVDALKVGDLVCTLDRGLQAIRWIGRRKITGVRMQTLPQFRPVLIRAGAFGLGLPSRDMRVSPQHRFLIRAAVADVMFGSEEVLIPAKSLINGTTILIDPEITGTTYIHLLFDQHEVIFAEGQPTESFHPGEQSIAGLDTDARTELLALFPELADNASSIVAARPSLRYFEAEMLRRGDTA